MSQLRGKQNQIWLMFLEMKF